MSRSPGVVRIVPGRNGQGEHVFTVLVKRSYSIADQKIAARCEHDAALRLTDAYYDGGEPDWSTVQYEGELAPSKPKTDVVVIARAHAPEGRPVDQMKVGMAIGDMRKVLLITGDRHCHHRPDLPPVFSEPQPFVAMEIRYDRAYGGRDELSDPQIPFHYPRNDKGKGVALHNMKGVIEGLALPNIEDPNDLLTPERVVIEDPLRWPLQPVPQGFGWRQRTWYPRSALLGACPPFLEPGTVTAEERAGLLPPDHAALARQNRLPPFEAHFNNGASIGQLFSHLQGNETVHLAGLTPQGHLQFMLPGDTPAVGLDLGEGLETLEVTLHTVSIVPDTGAMDLIWQASRPYPGYEWLPHMTRLHAEVA
jgi:hypothetical protein